MAGTVLTVHTAQLLEFDFDPSEPRDDRGRWSKDSSITGLLATVPMKAADPTKGTEWSQMTKVNATWKFQFDKAGVIPHGQTFPRRYADFAHNWSSSPIYAQSIREVAMGLPGNHTQVELNEGEFLASLLDQAPTIDKPLYRAMDRDDFGSAINPFFAVKGDTFSLGPSSFSQSKSEAMVFTNHVEGAPIVLDVTPGARGLPIGTLSDYVREQEVISAGTFRVLAPAEEVEDLVYGTYQLLRVEQVS